MKCQTKSFLISCVALAFMLAGCGTNNPSGYVPSTPSYPVLDVSPDTLDFGLDGIIRELIISNEGGDTLAWYLTGIPDWIEVSLDSGTTTSLNSFTVLVELNRSQLDPGFNMGAIEVESNAGDLTIPLYATYSSNPVIGELPDALDFGFSENDLQMNIFNAGQDTLKWSASVDNSLFSIIPDSGETVEETQVVVSFDRDNAPLQLIYATLTITTGSESKQVVLAADNGDVGGGWFSHTTQTSGYYSPRPVDYFYIVRFDRPDDWIEYKIDSVAVQLYSLPDAFDDISFFCWDSQLDPYGSYWPDLDDLRYWTPALNPISGWSIWSVDWQLDLPIFFAGYYQINWIPIIFPMPYFDSSNLGGYSFLAWEIEPTYLTIEQIAIWEWCIEVHAMPIETTSGSTAGGGQWLKPTVEPFSGQTQRIPVDYCIPSQIRRN